MNRIFIVFVDWLNCRTPLTSYAVTGSPVASRQRADVAERVGIEVGIPGFQWMQGGRVLTSVRV